MDKGHQLSDSITASATVLERGSESIRAVIADDENRFSRALRDLRELAEAEHIPLAIVGGLAAIRFGYHAASPNIEIVVADAHLARLLHVAPQHGFNISRESPTGWHTLTHEDVEVNIVPAGGKANPKTPTTIPSPAQLGVTNGLNFASLPGWVEIQLSSGLWRDRAHVVEVMKKATPAALVESRTHIESVHELYLATFDQLLAEARAERAQEGERGRGAESLQAVTRAEENRTT